MERVINFLSSGKTAAFLVSLYVLISLINDVYQSFPEWRIPYEWAGRHAPDYADGFRDGCPSGLSAGGNLWVHLRHEFQRDVQRMDNEFYKQGWNEGFSLCRSSVNAPLF